MTAQQLPQRRFSVDEYHKLLEVGILQSGDPVELLDGYLVMKMSRNPPHELVSGLVEDALIPLIPAGYFRRGQLAMTTPDSEPEPDVALARGGRRDYGKRHPGAQDMVLVVEVADTSLDRDRQVKGPLYARASVPVYWIVNINERQVEVYTGPSGPGDDEGYAQRRDYGEADALPLVLDGVMVGAIPVRELLP